MASPLKSGKQTVDLAAQGARAPGSRIRRDPPPKPRQTVVPDREEVERWSVGLGVGAVALAILIIIAGLASYQGWSPSEVVYRM